MTDNVREWSLQLDAEFAAMMGGVRQAIIATAIEAQALLEETSPVDTGQFRANWHVSVGGPDALVQEGPGPELAEAGMAALAAYPEDAYPVIVAGNNLPYAIRLEEGSSTQAPAGVVAVVAPAVQAYWNGTKL